jgi:hypothetical protein
MSATAFDDDVDRETADPGITLGGIRDRAMRTVLRSARRARTRKKRASQQYWAALKRRRNRKGVSAEVLREHDEITRR